MNKISAAIGIHEMNDESQLQSLFDKYNIPASERESLTKICNILKDADAIDRTRFPGNLDEKYLRTEAATI